jgi:GNAT superfamily N-acetyltransferase
MKIYEVATQDLDLSITNSVTGSFRGGYDGVLVAKTPDQQVGYLEYSVYNDVPAIKIVEVLPEFRRHKIAKRLLKALQELSPNHEIQWGYTTDAGSKLKQSIDFVNKPRPEITKKKEKLRAIKSKLTKLNYKLENLKDKNPEAARKFINSVSDKWNKLNDLEHRLENELSYDNKEYTRLIPESEKMKPVSVKGKEKPGAVDELKSQLIDAKSAGKSLK